MSLLAAVLPRSMIEKRVEAFIQSYQSLKNIPVVIELWNGKRFELGSSPKVLLRFNSPASILKLSNPDLSALGEAYAEGELDAEGHIRDVINVATKLANGLGPKDIVQIKPVKHSKRLDEESIQHHYDVSNDFYQLWLDKEMVYSCAYFRHESDTLEQAQIQKIDHILQKLCLKSGQRLLDIGCGWGALVLRAAKQFGVQCTGITLSEQQFELATQRVREAGLEDRITILLQDYRDVLGRFDRITSVGMFEHVGLKNLGAYFKRIYGLLEDDGVVMNHGITSINPESGDSPLGGGRFIDQYVFPNGELPHIGLALKRLAEAGLEVIDVENLRRHYARTLDCWTDRFEAHTEQLRKIAGEKRYRVWRAYLAGCAYGFHEGWIEIHQILAVKARSGSDPLPMTREYIYPQI